MSNRDDTRKTKMNEHDQAVWDEAALLFAKEVLRAKGAGRAIHDTPGQDLVANISAVFADAFMAERAERGGAVQPSPAYGIGTEFLAGMDEDDIQRGRIASMNPWRVDSVGGSMSSWTYPRAAWEADLARGYVRIVEPEAAVEDRPDVSNGGDGDESRRDAAVTAGWWRVVQAARKTLGACSGENIPDAARRLVIERDNACTERDAARHALGARDGESTADAAARVVRERKEWRCRAEQVEAAVSRYVVAQDDFSNTSRGSGTLRDTIDALRVIARERTLGQNAKAIDERDGQIAALTLARDGALAAAERSRAELRDADDALKYIADALGVAEYKVAWYAKTKQAVIDVKAIADGAAASVGLALVDAAENARAMCLPGFHANVYSALNGNGYASHVADAVSSLVRAALDKPAKVAPHASEPFDAATLKVGQTVRLREAKVAHVQGPRLDVFVKFDGDGRQTAVPIVAIAGVVKP